MGGHLGFSGWRGEARGRTRSELATLFHLATRFLLFSRRGVLWGGFNDEVLRVTLLLFIAIENQVLE